jgi:hypothetical protein
MTVLRVDTIAASGQTSENTGSVFFDGTGDCLTVPDGSDFEFGSDNFTIEAYIYYTGSPGTSGDTYAITSKWDNQSAPNDKGLILRISDDGSGDNLQWFYTTDGSTNDITTGSTILSPESWYHIAFVRNGTVGTFYINGISDATTVSFGSDSIRDTGNPFRIGANLESGAIDQEFQGFISNARVIKGKALYTSNFTVPTRELEVTPETVLVCCHDGENIFAEKTGKIIAAYGDRLSSPTPTATDSPIGITTFQPGLTRGVDVTAGPVLQGNLEYNSQNFLVLPKGTTTERFPDFGAVDASSARGIFFGGGYSSPTLYDVIDYVTISTTGNAQDFGNLTLARSTTGACSSLTRGVCAGGFDGSSFYNLMDYVTISSTGNAQDFGDLSGIRIHIGGCSNSIRGIFGGGWSPQKNIIEYITISSTGNAFDFGDLTTARFQPASFSSTTRGIFAGGTAPPSNLNTIDYITIASTGNAVDFGDLNNTASATGLSNSTRGLAVFTSGSSNAIDFVTIASLGNATDFGDQTVANREISGSFASSIRGVIGGGSGASTGNVIDYVTIAQTGNAQDFGDLTQQRNRVSGCSNGHGGLG